MHLRVRPLKRKDAGSGLAAIDRELLDELAARDAEFVEIEGRDGRVIARVWPGSSEDTGRGIIRIDGQLHQAAGARIDDRVTVEPADVERADRDLDAIELTAEHFEQALEEVSPESAAEFETGPQAGAFDEVREGGEGEA